MLPASCALLLSMPSSRAEFFDGVVQGAYCSDYLSQTVGADVRHEDKARLLRRAEHNWERGYQQICQEADGLIAIAERLGVHVVRAATLEDLRRCSAQFSTLILFAHWKGSTIYLRDVRAHVLSIGSALRSTTHPLSQWLVDEFSRSAPYAKTASRKEFARQFLNFVNILIESERVLHAVPGLLPERLLTLFGESPLFSKTMSRDLLDEALSIEPGNKLELFDGLHSPGVVEQTIAASFRGTLELAGCQSAVLASFIRNKRGNALTIINGTTDIHTAVRYAKVRTALSRSAQSGCTYLDARFEVEEQWNAL
jgi:hypothetical protein